MKLPRLFSAVCFLFLAAAAGVHSAEFINGSVRLVLHEDTGRFSLYRVNDDARIRYEPFFSDQDPRTSFFTVSINGKTYKLGDAYSFKITLRADANKPALVFTSTDFEIIEEFVFIKTPSSDRNNGVAVNVSIDNRTRRKTDVGLRFLLDTNLGENGSPSFVTEVRPVTSETLIETGNLETRWISQNANLSFMGSITAREGEGPDSVMFANWKRLSDAPFKAPYSAGRNFNAPPYSVGDSAVCYVFEPRPLERGERRVCSFMLAATDERGFYAAAPTPSSAEDARTKARDLAMIQFLITQIDSYIAAGRVSDAELSAMEETLNYLLDKYRLAPAR
jgi:hypothetical protein